MQQRCRRRRSGRQFRKRIVPGRFRHARSGAQRRAATPMEPRLARARASPVSLAVGVLERGLRPMMARRKRGRRGASELARGYPSPARFSPSCCCPCCWAAGAARRPWRFRLTPAAAVARRHARRRVLPNSVARHQHQGRIHRGRITGALLGPRCKLRRRLVPALALLTRFARRCRQPKLPSSASGIANLIVAATLTAVPVPGTALALGPLGTGARPARHRQRWFPTAPPRSYSALRFAAWPAPMDGDGTAASSGCAAVRRRR